MFVAHRIRLDPNNMQATYFARAAGTARFAYNWALAEWKRQYEANKLDAILPRPDEVALCRQLNALKRVEFPWMLEVTKNAPQMAIIQLGRAFKNLLARLHARIADLRRNGLHQLTTSITRRFHTIGIEDLHVKGMLANKHLARAVADMGFYELRRQLMYKAAWRGGQVVVASRWYPSSKTCSSCAYQLDKLGLGTRQWTCPACGVSHNRDVNAAVNLKNMAVSSTVTACGGEGAGPARKRRAKPAPGKQESSSEAEPD